MYVYVLTIILYVSFDCRNMIKSFYTSSLLFDVLNVFGELSDEVRKLFILHVVCCIDIFYDEDI